jgi:glycosyltransferase involved in cell wall biosynthesis
MRFSVIIPTYNRADKLPLAVESILGQNYPESSFEIIIGNNNSSDSTEDCISKLITNKTVSTPIRHFNETRQGVHYVRNHAAQMASGELLYFTDDDMLAEKNVLAEFDAIFKNFEQIGAAMGKVTPKWAVKPPDWILKYFCNHNLSLMDRPEELVISNQDVGVFSCHEVVPKDVLLKAGGFNPEYTKDEYLGDGETGLHRKIKSLGYKFAYTAKAMTQHLIPKERLTQRDINKRFANQGIADAFSFCNKKEVNQEMLIKRANQATQRSRSLFFLLLLHKFLNKSVYHVTEARYHYHKTLAKHCNRLAQDAELLAFSKQTNFLS